MADENISAETHDRRVALARTIWRLELGEEVPESPTERNERFVAVKADYIAKARKAETILKRLGYDIIKTD